MIIVSIHVWNSFSCSNDIEIFGCRQFRIIALLGQMSKLKFSATMKLIAVKLQKFYKWTTQSTHHIYVCCGMVRPFYAFTDRVSVTARFCMLTIITCLHSIRIVILIVSQTTLSNRVLVSFSSGLGRVLIRGGFWCRVLSWSFHSRYLRIYVQVV